MGPLVGATEISESLTEAGNNLLKSHSSTDSTLTLLDKIESLLATVEQDPPDEVKKALIPSMKALISADLLRNPDSDVKVSVISCLTEIMRITAPEAPYEDDHMKEIFEVTIEAFGKLADSSGRSYKKAEAVLDTVSRVRSALVMMDLECDELILEMFRQFLKLIRPDHPQVVSLAMETIMITVLDESEEISSDLVGILLASVKKDSQDVSTTATVLVEKVLSACASKLKPCIMDALKSPRASVDMYSPVILSICESEIASTQTHNIIDAKENEEEQVVPSESLEDKLDLGPSHKGNRSKRTARIKIRQANRDNKVRNGSDIKQLSKQGQSESTDAETESGSTRKRGRKPNSRMNPEEGYSFNTSLSTKVPEKELGNSSLGKLATKKASLAKAGQTNQSVVISLSSSDRKSGKRSRSKMEEANPDLASLPTPTSKKQIVKKDHPEEEDLMESSLERPEDGIKTAKSGKKEGTQKGLAKTPAKKPLAETKMVKTTGKKTVHPVAQKKNSKGASTDTHIPQSPKSKKKTSLAKMTSSSKESKQTLKSNPKRKRTAGEEVESNKKEFGVELVGKRVKIWWPLDNEFYEGNIKSYCKNTKKHEVLYSDGESEVLNLKKERWEIIPENSSASEDKEIDSIVLADFIKKTKAKKSKNASKNVERSSSPEARSSVQTIKKKDSVRNSTKQVKKAKGALKAESSEPESSEVKDVKSLKHPNAEPGRTKGRSQKRQRVTRAGQPESEKDIDMKEEPEANGEDSKRDHQELPSSEIKADGGELKSTKESIADPKTDGEEREVAEEPIGEPKADGEELKVAKESTAEPKTDGDEHKSLKETNAEPETGEEEQKSPKKPNAEPETEVQEGESAKEHTEDTKLIQKDDMSEKKIKESGGEASPTPSVPETREVAKETEEDAQREIKEAEGESDKADDGTIPISA